MVLMLVSIAFQKRCKSTVFLNRNYITPSFITDDPKKSRPNTLKSEHSGGFYFFYRCRKNYDISIDFLFFSSSAFGMITESTPLFT